MDSVMPDLSTPFGARVARRLREEHVIWLTTTAQLTPGEPPADQVPAYVDKYRDHLRRLNYTPESFAAAYSVAMRVRPRKVRGH